MNATLFKKEIKSNWLLLVIFLAVLSVYGSMITMMYNPEMGDSLKMMADSMPDLFAAFGMADVGQTLLDFVSGYLYGMLYVAFPGAVSYTHLGIILRQDHFVYCSHKKLSILSVLRSL